MMKAKNRKDWLFPLVNGIPKAPHKADVRFREHGVNVKLSEQ